MKVLTLMSVLLLAISCSGGEPTRSTSTVVETETASSLGTIRFLRGGYPGRPVLMSGDGSEQRSARVPGFPTYSPDGRKVVFSVEQTPGNARLYVANADGSNRRAISRLTANCFGPDWSPDGKKIAYTDGCEVDFTTIYIVNRDGSGLRKLDPGYWQLGPEWSPDGRAILFTAYPHPFQRPFTGWRLFLIDPDGRHRRVIRGTYPKSRFASYFAQWSPDGKKIYFVSTPGDPREDRRRLFVMSMDGRAVRPLSPASVKVREYELSPDGRKIVFVGVAGKRKGWEIYAMNSDGSDVRQLTNNRVWDIEATWSPDRQRIVFTRILTQGRDGNSEIFVMNADGTGQANLSRNPADDWAPSWVLP
jgi:Tol biopolymer transport system component